MTRLVTIEVDTGKLTRTLTEDSHVRVESLGRAVLRALALGMTPRDEYLLKAGITIKGMEKSE